MGHIQGISLTPAPLGFRGPDQRYRDNKFLDFCIQGEDLGVDLKNQLVYGCRVSLEQKMKPWSG